MHMCATVCVCVCLCCYVCVCLSCETDSEGGTYMPVNIYESQQLGLVDLVVTFDLSVARQGGCREGIWVAGADGCAWTQKDGDHV